MVVIIIMIHILALGFTLSCTLCLTWLDMGIFLGIARISAKQLRSSAGLRAPGSSSGR